MMRIIDIFSYVIPKNVGSTGSVLIHNANFIKRFPALVHCPVYFCWLISLVYFSALKPKS